MIAIAPPSQTEPKKEQFFKATLEGLKEDYRKKILTAEAYLYYIIKAKRAANWKWRFNVKQFCAEWEIRESTFYRALSKLKAKNAISWRPGDNTIVLWWGKEVPERANVDSSDSPNRPNLYTVEPLQHVREQFPDVREPFPDVREPLQDIREQNAQTIAVPQSCNTSYSLQIDPKINTDFHEEVCVVLEKNLDQDPEGDQQKFHHHNDETNLDAITGSRTTLLVETDLDAMTESRTSLLEEMDLDAITGSRTTLLDEAETLQVVDKTNHKGQGFAAPRHKTSQKPLQKQEWKCLGSAEEKNAFLKMKGELLAKEKKCLPMEGRAAALGWANRNPEAANLLWEDWQHQLKQQEVNQNIGLKVVPEFHRMPSEEHASLLEKFLNLDGEAFIELCSWHKYWLQFATTPGSKQRIDGLTPEIIKQIREVLRCTA